MEEEETPVSRVPNPIPEIVGSIKLKRGRPPKMSRELQVSLSPLSLSCTQRFLQKNAGHLMEDSSDSARKLLKRGRPPKLQGKIKFNFLASKFGSSKVSPDEKPPSTSSSNAGDKDDKEYQEISEPNSGSTEEKSQSHHEEEGEDSSWPDDYGFYRPVRAAAAAAMEAVQGRKTQDELIRLRLRNKVFTKQPPPKGRNRRTIVRRTVGQVVTRGITTTTSTTTSQSIFHRGIYYQEGDIVTITGDEDHQEYYCQIKSIMRDYKFMACATLRWLTPRRGFKGPLLPFKPANFQVCDGVPEQIFSLDCVKFVMHCPHDYYFEHPVTFFQPVKNTVYMRLGEPLVSVEIVPIVPPCNIPSQDTESNGSSEVPSDS